MNEKLSVSLRQKFGSHWPVAWSMSSEPYTSTTLLEPTRLQAFGGGAKVSGTVMRSFQFDGLHHRLPLTVSSLRLSPWPDWGAPGW